MSRYIDTDTLKYHTNNYCQEIVTKDEIDAMPSADVVEVVRCKDCKHRPYLDEDGFIEPENSICPCINEDDDDYSWLPEDDWFCADGERREDVRKFD